MAKILVISDDDRVIAEVTEDDEAYASFTCRTCGLTDSDRGHFADTVAVASIHVDRPDLHPKG